MTIPKKRRTQLALLFLFAFAASGQNEPVFRSGTRLVEVNVIVRDRNGPVAGLTKENFTILDNGKPRPVSLFSATVAGAPPQRAAPLPPDVFSNRLNPSGDRSSTATILLLDRTNTPLESQPWANAKAIQFLQQRKPGDRLGIYTLGKSLRVIQDLTDDSDRLERAARNLKPENAARLSADVKVDATGDAVTDGMIARSLESLEDVAAADRVGNTRRALEAIARHLAAVPGRKNLVWVSAAFPLFVQRAHYNVDFSRDIDAAARALTDADIAVYPVDVRGLIASSGTGSVRPPEEGTPVGPGRATVLGPPDVPQNPDSGRDTMNALAALTGGQAFYNSNGIVNSIERASEDAKVTYTLGSILPITLWTECSISWK